MGRKRKRIVRTKPIPSLPTVFDCPKCGASKTLNIDIDRKIRTAVILCGKCKTQIARPIRPIEERVDVFGNWLDELEAEANEEEENSADTELQDENSNNL
ncbi:MAG: transcription elongation factor 1 family protein [Candidatus Hodarchaeales archaeon]|jgi:transcription elongation factor Elf1